MLAGRRIRGAPAELTDLERLQYRSVAYGLAASLTLPRASLGRDRFHVASQGLAAAQPQPLTPLAQAAETGRFAAGAVRELCRALLADVMTEHGVWCGAAVRSLAYGSAAGLAGAAIVGALMYRLWLSTQVCPALTSLQQLAALSASIGPTLRTSAAQSTAPVRALELVKPH